VASMRALIISADNFEDSELRVPYDRLTNEGIEVDIASLAPGIIRGKHGYCSEAMLSVGEVDPAAYDLLILPGGKAPAVLRTCSKSFQQQCKKCEHYHGSAGGELSLAIFPQSAAFLDPGE